jgi:hypothetical protein
VELALRIQCRGNRMFYRAAAAFPAVARPSKHKRNAGIPTIIVVREVKRLEVMRDEDALYVYWRPSRRAAIDCGDPEIRLKGGKEVL